MKAEDDDFARFCGASPASGGADDMQITAAGNVTLNQQAPAAKQSGLLPKLALAASLASGSAGVGYIVNDLLKPTPTAAESADTDTITEMDFPAEGN